MEDLGATVRTGQGKGGGGDVRKLQGKAWTETKALMERGTEQRWEESQVCLGSVRTAGFNSNSSRLIPSFFFFFPLFLSRSNSWVGRRTWS